ncbi:hypothetical protein [Thauera humireducens]|uniref:hypothetical protein n=1 Tax=Thauera humireducens TaxID=1134435 RepID=UPI00311F68FA
MLQTGTIATGIELVERPNPRLTLAEYWDTVTSHRPDPVALKRIAAAEGLRPTRH